MKKLFTLTFILSMFVLASCGSEESTEIEVAIDSVGVDSVAVDSVIIDTVALD